MGLPTGSNGSDEAEKLMSRGVTGLPVASAGHI
jgi:hypothetical protein